jgi:hypothetical protein
MKVTIKKDSEAAKAFETLREKKKEFKDLVESGKIKENSDVLDNEHSISSTSQPITFILKNNEPLIIIDETGFKYKGDLIEDSGEVYKLFKDFLRSSKILSPEIFDEEIENAARDFYWSRQPKGKFMAENSRPDMVIGFVRGVKWYMEQINNLKNISYGK